MSAVLSLRRMAPRISPIIVWMGVVAGAAPILTHIASAQDLPLSQTAQMLRDDAKNVGDARFTAPDYKPGLVRHMVMFRFKPHVTLAERNAVTKRFVALARISRRPDGRAVVASIETGPQISGENADFGLEQGYLVTFRSQGDRNFYVGRPIVTNSHDYDGAHDAFKTFAAPYLERVAVFDFPVISRAQP